MKNKISINQKLLWNIIIVLINIFVFFGYLIPQRSAFLLVTAFISLIIYITLYKKIYKEVIRKNIVWLLILVFFFIQLLYTINFALSMKFIMTYGAVIIIKMVFDSISIVMPDYNWKNNFLKTAIFCSGIHVLATILYNCFPDFIIAINSKILTVTQYSYNKYQHWQGLNPGICDDYGFNAFCNLTFTGLILCKFFSKKKLNFIIIACLICGLLAMAIIGKRGHLVCLILAAIICFFISFKDSSLKKRVGIIFGVIILATLTYYIISMVPATSIIIERLNQSKTVDGLLNGREIIYQHSIETFLENPIMGIGIRGVYAKYVMDGHNIYLQILAETGIIGSFLLFSCFIYYLIKSFIVHSKCINENTKYIILFSIFTQLFFLINGITENPFYIESILIFYLIITSFCTKEKSNSVLLNNKV